MVENGKMVAMKSQHTNLFLIAFGKVLSRGSNFLSSLWLFVWLVRPLTDSVGTFPANGYWQHALL